MSSLADRIDALDLNLFSFLTAQTTEFGRRALLALHAAAADTLGTFSYLEIGSYLGGSLQALMRDPRCQTVISIDPRPPTTPDARGRPHEYESNTTEHMLELLSGLPEVDMNKVTPLEASSATLRASDLPIRPGYCFIDGEHTHAAVLRDARFCAEALGGAGVIAFHDYVLIGSGVRSFLRVHWREISYALAFSGPGERNEGGGVFAVELGGGGLLRHPAIDRAVGSRWHSVSWAAANRSRRSSLPAVTALAAIPVIDKLVARARQSANRPPMDR